METQFPVSKLSKESYRERKSPSQTLTGVGKWWGRKPLILCRAIIIGLLLPATVDPAKDREVFLRLLTMDDDGMLRRKSKSIPATELFRRLGPSDRVRYFEPGSEDEKAKLKKGLARVEKEELQRRVFLSLPYDQRLEYCDRPEQIDGPSPDSWRVINDHLGTAASALPELVTELGKRRFGRTPRVGDSFCGGGSVPFEAARLGCEAYGSDLSPVAALLTWAALNVVGGAPAVAERVQEMQREVFETVDRLVTVWGIEHREPDPVTGRRWRADAYLYCVEVNCPECKWRVPLAPSWVVAEKTKVIARLVPDPDRQRYEFAIAEGVSDAELRAAALGTLRKSELVCPNCLSIQAEKARTPIRVVRGDGRGTFGDGNSLLRAWENRDIVPRKGDVFGERIYCIRWLDAWIDEEDKQRSERHYCPPTVQDLVRENRVLALVMERFDEWQKQGFIPSRRIEPGYNTTQPIRERGWTHWHHLFTPRQLLAHGLLMETAAGDSFQPIALRALSLLGVGYCCNWNSRLCMWNVNLGKSGGIGATEQTFANQALNTLSNYGNRSFGGLRETFVKKFPALASPSSPNVSVMPASATQIAVDSDLWITDPPYADAVNYEEVSEFFLAWYAGQLTRLFPDWYSDSKRALAVKGDSDGFRKVMVDCYTALADHMPTNGLQVVMFTHQDAGVWADLALILWAAGLRVTSAWCIGTETSTGLTEGNYVQGTVLLVLRKQTVQDTAFLDEVYPEVESEVRRQLDSMLALDDADDPNFSYNDYQLAAYAAALRVLTSKKIEEIDVSYELTRTRLKGEASLVEEVIRNGVRIACDHLVPRGIERYLWKSLTALERFYLKGLEVESQGEYRNGVYQELARGFGAHEYKTLLASTKANQTRLKTANEFGRKDLGGGFGDSLVRHALFGVFKTAETENPRDAITWFTTEVKGYAASRQSLIEILEFLAALRQNASLSHWHKDADAAALLAGALRNRQDNV